MTASPFARNRASLIASISFLQEGTVVDEADLELQDGIASFEKIELVK
jgi:hypothetical protein